MSDLNHVVLIGRLTREAELKYIADGQAVCEFSIAVNRSKKNGDQWEDEVNFFDIVLWGKQGESKHPYLVKGKQIVVDGALRQERWQQDGQNRSKIKIVANNIQLLGGGGGSGGDRQNNNNNNNNNNSSSNNSQESQSYAGSSGKDDGFTDDIPF